MPASRRRCILGLLALLAPKALGQGSDALLRSQLELVYAKWRDAVRQRNAKECLAHTSRFRQMSLRNEIVSAGLAWPKALFDLALMPPDIIPLKALDTRVIGPTARIVYFGNADFGIQDAVAPENLLVLHFLKEGDAWKFNTAQYVNITDPEQRKKTAAGDLSPLSSPEFGVTGAYPELPKPCAAPYQVAKLNITALGGRIKATVNGQSYDPVQDTLTSRIIIGGLNKGPNKLSIEPVATDSAATKRQIQVTITVPTAPGQPEREIFKWEPKPDEKLGTQEHAVWVQSKSLLP